MGNELRQRGDLSGRDVMAEAIEWLRKGEFIVERMELRNVDAPGVKDLKVRACYHSWSLTLADRASSQSRFAFFPIEKYCL